MEQGTNAQRANKEQGQQVEEKKSLTRVEAEAKIAAIREVLEKNFFDVDDPLEEYARTKGLIDILSENLKELKKDAIFAASVLLHDESPARESGRFEYKGYVFELSLEETFDFVKNPNRYTNETGVQYRQLAREQAQLKKSAEAKTKLMKALKDNFAAEHPDWAPDSVTKSIKYLGLNASLN